MALQRRAPWWVGFAPPMPMSMSMGPSIGSLVFPSCAWSLLPFVIVMLARSHWHQPSKAQGVGLPPHMMALPAGRRPRCRCCSALTSDSGKPPYSRRPQQPLKQTRGGGFGMGMGVLASRVRVHTARGTHFLPVQSNHRARDRMRIRDKSQAAAAVDPRAPTSLPSMGASPSRQAPSPPTSRLSVRGAFPTVLAMAFISTRLGASRRRSAFRVNEKGIYMYEKAQHYVERGGGVAEHGRGWRLRLRMSWRQRLLPVGCLHDSFFFRLRGGVGMYM
ncbi:hypothetical protein B0H11DRAFT_2022131 [Mycena galericulata]|nr:hypothetical protein B0H11DRAFT_2022131 [Mycena galericulata]